jgi:AcrR family transcriptional regulator
LAGSLRERQRERRQRLILDAATELIGQKGFDDTSIEEIAERAEVGVATVYNYFGSKSELLGAMLVRYIEEEARLGEAVVTAPPEKMSDGMSDLFSAYLHGMAERCSPRLLQEFLALAVSKQFSYGRQTYELKLRFLEQCRLLAAHYKREGQVSKDVTVDEATAACYSAAALPLAMFSVTQAVDVDTAVRMLRRQMSLVITGIGNRQG